MSDGAAWIWRGDAGGTNQWTCLRRVFRAPRGLRAAELLVSADSRCEVYLNGNMILRGPGRGFPWAYGCDRVDLVPHLREGEDNVIAILAVHWGESTFQYIKGAPGVLAELSADTGSGLVPLISTDASWRVAPHPAFAQKAPRISYQLPFEEQYDARLAPAGWETLAFDDRAWTPAVEVARPGDPPWVELAARGVPPLAEALRPASAVIGVELARRPAGLAFCADLKVASGIPGEGVAQLVAPVGSRAQLLVTELLLEEEAEVTICFLAAYGPGATRIFIDDRHVPEGVPTRVPAGRHMLSQANPYELALTVLCDKPIAVTAERVGGVDGGWVLVGPLDERRDESGQMALGGIQAVLGGDHRRVSLPPGDMMDDIFALTATQRFWAVRGGRTPAGINGPVAREEADADAAFVENPDGLLGAGGGPTRVMPTGNGDAHLVIDFGVEVVGHLELDVEAPAGTVLDFNCFEGIDRSGIFWTAGLRNSMRYTCAGGRAAFRSHQRRGFRYASLTVRSAGGPVDIHRVGVAEALYDAPRIGGFECSDPVLTRTWQTAVRTVHLCMEDTYVDCPAYEQTYWVGDARNSALVNAVAFGALGLTQRCVQLAGQSLDPRVAMTRPPTEEAATNIVNALVPSGWAQVIPMWSFLWVWMAWEHRLWGGSREQLAQTYPAVRECLRRAHLGRNARGLLDFEEAWNLVDWAPMDLERSGEAVCNSLLLVAAEECAALMADELGDSAAAAAHRGLAGDVRAAVQALAWHAGEPVYVDTVRDENAYATYTGRCLAGGLPIVPYEEFRQRGRISVATNTLALLCGCVPADRQEAVLDFVIRNLDRVQGTLGQAGEAPDTGGVVPVGSPWFMFFVLEVLFREGRGTTAVDIMRARWGEMLEMGATSFWETFPAGPEALHPSRSLCHGWSAAPAYFLSTEVLGVSPAAPGFETVTIAPIEVPGISWARGAVPSPRGLIEVQWTREGGDLRVTATVPAGMTVLTPGPGTITVNGTLRGQAAADR